MTHELKQRELLIDLTTREFQIKRITDERIIGPVDYGWVRFQEAAEKQDRADPTIITWGGGPLAGSRIPGTRRLVFSAYSPQWEGFFVSSLGGACYVMHRVGVDFFCLTGTAPQDSVLLLNHKNGEISVRLEPIDVDAAWVGHDAADGRHLIGFHALQEEVFQRYKDEYTGDWVRVMAVGPAGRHTKEGVIGSNHVKQGTVTPIDDWAGRGGLGSRLLQQHRIAAVIFGGEWQDPDLKDSKEIDGYFQEHYGESMFKVDLGLTQKYKYVPDFETGGTFGVNMHTMEDRLLSFNYSSIYESDVDREALQEKFITTHYLRQFNEEIIQPKNFNHCGEPCAVACKKVDRHYKKDFEPYQALGPLCGVFDQRAAEVLNHFVDGMGLDAIQTGGTVSWIMELVREGLIDPAEYGFPPQSEMRFAFASDEVHFDKVKDSKINAQYAQNVIHALLFAEKAAVFRLSIRAAAKALDVKGVGVPPPTSDYAKRGDRAIDRAVFISHGENGSMIPNQYWVPGVLAPMPMMGKYFMYYGQEFRTPRELGQLCVERMVYELFSENTGVCRFHRKWAEVIVDEIISAHYEFPVDYKAHQYRLAQAIHQQEGAKSVPWESERTIDVIAQYLEKWGRFGLKDAQLDAWRARFQADKWQAGRDYWLEMKAGIDEAFAAGADAIPDKLSPGQKGS